MPVVRVDRHFVLLQLCEQVALGCDDINLAMCGL